jgi:hypothetical protein
MSIALDYLVVGLPHSKLSKLHVHRLCFRASRHLETNELDKFLL